ncbi:MAG TPA: preprotein translocase subunit SecE [Solirubrobacteraceae bacterium]|nr:preprotein translocase subunit SecE [Solirubrobacteraceae bacterium]
MARNRKRAKERRDRRPQAVTGRSGLAAAGSEFSEGSPSPLEHAAPDAELADAQLALGSVEALEEEPFSGEAPQELDRSEELADDYPEELDGSGSGNGGGVGIGGRFSGGGGTNPPGGGGAVPLPAPGAAPARPRARLLAFLEGSWRELQRVQWPDRRQVMQATAVVLGFVIVAGVFLGVADTVSSHFMNAVLIGGNKVWLWVGVGIIVSSLALWTFTQRDR